MGGGERRSAAFRGRLSKGKTERGGREVEKEDRDGRLRGKELELSHFYLFKV